MLAGQRSVGKKFCLLSDVYTDVYIAEMVGYRRITAAGLDFGAVKIAMFHTR